MSVQTFHDCWQLFLSRCVPVTTPHDEIVKLKKAYYSGAFGLLTLLSEMDTSDTVAGAAKVEAWHQEIACFMKMGGMSS